MTARPRDMEARSQANASRSGTTRAGALSAAGATSAATSSGWAVVSLGLAAALALGGCIRFRSDAPPPPASDAASTPAPDDGGSDVEEGATDESDGGAQDATSDGPLPPICQRFDTSIANTIAENTLSGLTSDCRINAYFASLPALRVDHFVQCLAAQIGSTLGCVRVDGTKVKYPAFDTAGKLCADMKSAHAAMQTSDGDFDAFLSAMVGAMQRAGLTTDEIARVTRAYGTTRSDIVRFRDAGPTRPCDAGANDAADDAR